MEEWLINYIRDWKNSPSPKPINDDVFLFHFIAWIKSEKNMLEFEFDGAGAYFGKQITISRFNNYGYDILRFEIAYTNTIIKIYDGNNEGYWVPEYVDINVDHQLFKELKETLFDFIKYHVGI